MNAEHTGKLIAELRKEKGLTQKQLAERLHVTDKAVSKWERGLNFPDLMLLDSLSAELGATVVQLLDIEDKSTEDVARSMADLAQQERNLIVREIVRRGWLTVILGLLSLFAAIYASHVLADYGVYGLPQAATGGMSGIIGLLIANGMVSIRNGNKLLK